MKLIILATIRDRRCWKLPQYGSVKEGDAINRRLYNNLFFVETAIYRVFGM
ncbi:MAG: hypothetical protein RM338_32600 [Nostoc sp. DedQUE12a]|nr:hypothetical protein [Nostoc sp. DedQUE12a]